MFPSNNCTTSNDSIIAYFNKTTFLNPNKNTNYINIFPNNNPKQEDNNLPPLNVQPITTPLPFFGFSTSPSPFELEDHEDHFFLHQNHLVNVSPHNSQPNHDHQNINNIVTNTTTNVVREPNTTATLVDSSLKMKKKINPPIDQEKISSRKRSTGKRDRHSKINTARGLRDRRMRLSLEVAREFFGLQDMLGFDKGSKTVEWLLTQSKPEIKKLERELNYFSSCTKSASSTNSEGEVVSCNLDEVAINIEQQHSTMDGSSSCKPLVASTKRKKRQLRKIVFNPLAKESREKARERARERKKEKDNLKSRSIRSSLASTIVVDHHHVSSKPSDQHQDEEIRNNNHDHLRLISCWSTTPYDQSREESGLSQSQNNNINNSSSLDVLPQEVEEPISSHQGNFTAAGDNNVNVDDHSFVNIEKYWSPSAALIFNSLHNNEISQHENFADFPIQW